MQPKVISPFLLLALLGWSLTSSDAGARGKEFWQSKPASEWSEEEVMELLNDSPWAQTALVSLFSMECPGALQGGGGKLDQASSFTADAQRYPLTIVWKSGLVDQGFARLQQLQRQTQAPILPQSRKKLEIYVYNPVALPCLVRRDDRSILEHAYLKSKTGKQLKPTDIVFAPDYEKSGYLVIEFPLPEDSFTLKDKEVEFGSKVFDRDFKVKFKLKSMVVNGTLQL